VKLDPAKYGKWGNCQFEAIGDQLDVSADVVRQQVVNYMRNNASKFEQFHIANELCWTDYLHKMTDTSTFGDNLTLQAAAFVYRVTFVICDAADEGRSLCISDQIDHQPTDGYITELLSGKCQIKLLGYYGEDHGAHYVSLAANTEDFLHDTVKRLFASRPPTKATPTQPADVEVGQQQQVGYETDILS